MATSNCSSVDELISLKLDVVAASSLLSSATIAKSPRSVSPSQSQQQIPPSPRIVVEQAPPSSPSPSRNANNITLASPKRAAKDVLSAQILIGMKHLIPSSSSSASSASLSVGSPNTSLSAPNSPLPIQAPLSPVSSDSEKPSSPRSDHQPPTNTCTFKECLLCKRGSPFVNNQSPTWACIMRIVFYCLQNEITSKPFLNLKTDVYGFMTAHWHLLCLDKKRSDNWHKQIQDMLSHSKNLFESGMDTYKQNGYWRMKQITDPWEEIKSKKVISKRKRSYSEADKDHSKNNSNNTNSNNNTNATVTGNNTSTATNSPSSSVVNSPAPASTPLSPCPTTTSSIDKKIHENFHQLSSQLNKHKESTSSPSPCKSSPTPPINLTLIASQVAAPITSSKSVSTPRLKKKQKVDHLIPAAINTSAPALVVNQAPIPTLPIISMLDDSSLKIDDSDAEINIEDVEEIKHYDDHSSMSLLLLSSTAVESSSKLLPIVREEQPAASTRSSSVADSSSTYLPKLASIGGNTSAPTSPPTVSSTTSLLLMKEEEISLLKQQLQLICSNLTLINQSNDPSTLQSMIEKEIKRISNVCNTSGSNQDIEIKPSTSTTPKSPSKLNSSIEAAIEDDCVPNISGLSSLMVAVTTNI